MGQWVFQHDNEHKTHVLNLRSGCHSPYLSDVRLLPSYGTNRQVFAFRLPPAHLIAKVLQKAPLRPHVLSCLPVSVRALLSSSLHNELSDFVK
ncbi:hypothetical protein J4Q44_G00367960 [Coregonus suidteri]|uniref:Uncharacterized protein n=1 Tax=Coregonus suidteri TaxID=861788 RepID=A0AAN8KQ59_9TELE